MDDNTRVPLQAVIHTICFFDMFKMPLSAFEIWYYLYQQESEYVVSYSEVLQALEFLLVNQVIEHTYEYYFLKGNEDFITLRKKRAKNSIAIFKKAHFYAWIMSYFPFVKMIGIANMAPVGNVDDLGDIDLFVVTKKNHLWTARFFVLLFLSLLRLRPGDRDDSPGRYPLCPSFFVAEDMLGMELLQRGNDDIYMKYWTSLLLPLYDAGGLRSRYDDENRWVKTYLPHIKMAELSSHALVEHSFLGKLLKRVVECSVMFEVCEFFLYKIQRKSLPPVKNTCVVLGEGIAKCHTNDRRELFFCKWKEQSEAILKSVLNNNHV